MKGAPSLQYALVPTYPSKHDRKRDVLYMVVETPKGSPYKFALDPERGLIALHHVLAHGDHWPYDYGFIPGTRGDDGDELDAVMLLDAPTFPGCLMRARLLGAIRLKKNDVENDRYILAPERMSGTPLPTDRAETLHDLGRRRIEELSSFLRGYSEAEGNDIEVVRTVERDEAAELVRRSRRKER